MTTDQELAPMKRRSFFAAAIAGIAGLMSFPLLRRSGKRTPAPPAANAEAPGKRTRVSIHPLAVRRNEKDEKKHG